MKIVDQRTLDQFDQLKEQLTAHRKKPAPKQVQNNGKSIISSKFRWVLPLFLIVGGGWVVHRNTTTLQDQLLEEDLISYQKSLAWSSLQTYIQFKWLQLKSTHKLTPSRNLASNCYLTRLQSDLLYLTERAPEKKIYIETNSKFSIGTLAWGNQEKIRYINQHGDLVELNRTSKLMFGSFLRIWSKATETLVKRQPIFAHYERQRNNIGNECERVNWLAKWELSKEEYQKTVSYCQTESKKISQKLRKLIEERLKKEKKLYKE